MTGSPGYGIDFPTLLQAAADLPVKPTPGVEDYGVPYAAAMRSSAHFLGQDVYHGTFIKCAAVLDILLRHPWLDHSQAVASWGVTVALLEINGYRIREDIEPKALLDLLTGITGDGVPLTEVARAIREMAQPINEA